MKLRGQTKRQAPVRGQMPGSMALGSRDPREAHRTDQAGASGDTYEFPLRTNPASRKVEMLNAADGAIAVDPSRGQYVRTAEPLTVQAHSPYALTLDVDPVSMVVKDGRLHAAPPLSRIRDDRVRGRPQPLRTALDAVEASAAAGVVAAAAAQADATSALVNAATAEADAQTGITNAASAQTTANSANAKSQTGTAVLLGGTIVVSLPALVSGHRIFLTVDAVGVLANLGMPYVSARTNGTGFTISSVNILDTSTIAWMVSL